LVHQNTEFPDLEEMSLEQLKDVMAAEMKVLFGVEVIDPLAIEDKTPSP
jgi:hypothetical protein